MVFNGVEQVFRSFLIDYQSVFEGVDDDDTISDVRLYLGVSATALVCDPVHFTKGDHDMSIPGARWPAPQKMNRLRRDEDFSRHEVQTFASYVSVGKVAVTDEFKVSHRHVRSLGEFFSVMGNSQRRTPRREIQYKGRNKENTELHL
jgi:hypothetical protein